MRWFEDAFERLLFSFVRRAPGWMVAVVALLLYVGLGLAVPLLLDWPVAWLVAANVWGTVLAGLVLLFWFLVQIQARDRRHLIEWTGNLRQLDSREFEWLVGECSSIARGTAGGSVASSRVAPASATSARTLQERSSS